MVGMISNAPRSLFGPAHLFEHGKTEFLAAVRAAQDLELHGLQLHCAPPSRHGHRAADGWPAPVPLHQALPGALEQAAEVLVLPGVGAQLLPASAVVQQLVGGLTQKLCRAASESQCSSAGQPVRANGLQVAHQNGGWCRRQKSICALARMQKPLSNACQLGSFRRQEDPPELSMGPGASGRSSSLSGFTL